MSTTRKVLIGVAVVSGFLIAKGDGVAYADWLHQVGSQLWQFIQAL